VCYGKVGLIVSLINDGITHPLIHQTCSPPRRNLAVVALTGGLRRETSLLASLSRFFMMLKADCGIIAPYVVTPTSTLTEYRSTFLFMTELFSHCFGSFI
jgi:hypothetical protein